MTEKELRDIYRRCDISNNRIEMPLGEDEFVRLITQYVDTREREGREWHKISVSDESTYPPFDTPVLARMTYDNKKFEPIYIVVKHVDEDDCSWRTSDGDELSYWVNVTHWQVIAELREEVNE